jgi:hypothetical protein
MAAYGALLHLGVNRVDQILLGHVVIDINNDIKPVVRRVEPAMRRVAACFSLSWRHPLLYPE